MKQISEHFHIKSEPIANSEAVLRFSSARFTILTSRLFRLEFDPDERFEDRTSQVAWFRNLPVPEFKVNEKQGRLEIETEHLHLKYEIGQPFTSRSLSIDVKETGATWQLNALDPNNLGGTARTLDKTNGPIPLDFGLISRSGWSLIEDSFSLVFDEDGWLIPRGAAPNARDLYFFGYGSDYPSCIQDYLKLSGDVPLVPRWALGNWWSRYWAYTQEELTHLMLEFEAHAIPLSVCIVDMDWHITRTGNSSTGWTGYSWNRDLFPDPDSFLDFLHDHKLRIALNLHPAEGVHPHEDGYQKMAKRMGIDPSTKQPVEFDSTDPNFIQAYFEILHHPLEEMGIDFWWLDWQHGEESKLPGLDPLWWLNHLHALDIARKNDKRRFIFSRWGGLGNHRYPVGFSGDTHVTWDALAFQPYFTATAANVGFGWWSHDIGGHMHGVEDPELFLRWVQFGVFSPIMRLHSSKVAFHERHPWKYDAKTFHSVRQAMQLRHSMIPYLYSMSWRHQREGKALVQPMYYLYPEQEAAYNCPNQYLFGSELIAAPFVLPRDPDTRLARQVVWFPEGDWFDFFTGRRYAGNGWHAIYGDQDEIPVFAKAGAIIPLAAEVSWSETQNPEHLMLHIFPGSSNEFNLYEDDGVTPAYQEGEYSITKYRLAWEDDALHFMVEPARGRLKHMPQMRRYTLVFHSIFEPEMLSIDIDGLPPSSPPSYLPETGTLTIEGIRHDPSVQFTVALKTQSGALLRREDSFLQVGHKLLKSFRMHTMTKEVIERHLHEIQENPSKLGDYLVSLTQSQERALLETVSQSGLVKFDSTGEPIIVLWNNHEDDLATHQVSVQRVGLWDRVHHFEAEGGPVPKFKVIRPAQEYKENAWLVKFNYHDLLTIQFTGNPYKFSRSS